MRVDIEDSSSSERYKSENRKGKTIVKIRIFFQLLKDGMSFV